MDAPGDSTGSGRSARGDGELPALLSAEENKVLYRNLVSDPERKFQ